MSASLRRTAPLLALLLLGAALPALAETPRQGTRSRVTQQEIETARQSNLLHFIRMHRPQWLRTRGAPGVTAPQVAIFLDGQRVGGPEQLRGISTEITSSLRYVDWREATTRWGSGHGSGAIMVTTGPLAPEIQEQVDFSDGLSR